MDETIKKRPVKWQKKLEQEKISYELYCIALASNQKNLLDIIKCNELLFQYYKQKEIYIVGLAKSRESAVLLVQDMIGNIYKETGNFDVKGYFRFKE